MSPYWKQHSFQAPRIIVNIDKFVHICVDYPKLVVITSCALWNHWHAYINTFSLRNWGDFAPGRPWPLLYRVHPRNRRFWVAWLRWGFDSPCGFYCDTKPSPPKTRVRKGLCWSCLTDLQILSKFLGCIRELLGEEHLWQPWPRPELTSACLNSTVMRAMCEPRRMKFVREICVGESGIWCECARKVESTRGSERP